MRNSRTCSVPPPEGRPARAAVSTFLHLSSEIVAHHLRICNDTNYVTPGSKSQVSLTVMYSSARHGRHPVRVPGAVHHAVVGVQVGRHLGDVVTRVPGPAHAVTKPGESRVGGVGVTDRLGLLRLGSPSLEY